MGNSPGNPNWVKGVSGNPAGYVRDKEFANTLRLVVHRDTPEGKKQLMVIAEKLVACAIDGDSWAIQQVADRLDGKASQESTLNVNDKRERTDWNVSDMVRALREHIGIPERSDSEVRRPQQPDKVH